MSEIIKAPKGTKDILPKDTPRWDAFFDAAEKTFRLYGYERIETPIFESEPLFIRAIGDGTDIVNKEMYSFADKGGRLMALRPEETAGVVRSYIENGLFRDNQTFRVFYRGPMFRYERPQGGRQRQFWQVGVEALGSAEPSMDAEVIDMALKCLSRAGLAGLTLRVNSVGCSGCRPKYTAALRTFILDKKPEFCDTCVERAGANPLRVFDCKNPGCRAVLAQAPLVTDYLCSDCLSHYEKVKDYLEAASTPFVADPTLVRGLDYYAKTVFEINSDALGAQDAVAAGGRYDGLVKKYGGPDIPGLGFAIGVERALLAVKEEQAQASGPDVYVMPLGCDALEAGVKLANMAREAGLTTITDYSGKPLKKQLALADRAGARLAMIIGEDELKTGMVTVRNMTAGDQTTLGIKSLPGWLKKQR